LSSDFVKTLLLQILIAAAVGLIITFFVYMGSRNNPKRYRPGRPFTFRPVWFLAAPERQARSGAISPRRELVRSAGIRPGRAKETGGASDRW
jgi:hypothetical protein